VDYEPAEITMSLLRQLQLARPGVVPGEPSAMSALERFHRAPAAISLEYLAALAAGVSWRRWFWT
jgi:hypothetical protein